MKKNLTELVFILDKSGSMEGLEKDTIGGFNSMLQKQKDMDGEVIVTTVLFDNEYELLHDRVNIQAIRPMNHKQYVIGGTTALLDAMGRTINKISKVQESVGADFKANNVIFIIITDGEENASREFSSQRIKKMIKHHKKHWGWEFIFLGANIDAVQTASSFGISTNRAQNFHADSEGIHLNFAVMSSAVSCMRTTQEIPDNWNEEIAGDFTKRAK